MKIINLTPHILTVLDTNGVPRELPVSGIVVRVSTTRIVSGDLSLDGSNCGIATSAIRFGPVTGLPPRIDGTVYVVSALVAAASPRADVYSPGELIRDEAGQPIACRGLTCSL